MGFKGNKTQVQNFLMQNKIVSQEKNEDVQNGIGASTGGIPKSLYGNELSEGWIEKINDGNDLLFWHNTSDSGRKVNIIGADSLPNKSYFCAQF